MATPSTPPPVGSVDHLAADRRVGRRCRTRLDPRRGWRLLLEALGVHDAPHPKTRQPCSRRVLGPARRCKQAFQKATSIPLASHGAGGEQADGHALGGRVALRQSRRHGCITRTVVIKHRRSLALRLTRSRRTSRMRGWTSLTLTRRANTWPFIYYYTKIHGVAPAEADMQRYFEVSPPSVHNMVVTLEKRGFITRTPGAGRLIQFPVGTRPVAGSGLSGPARPIQRLGSCGAGCLVGGPPYRSVHGVRNESCASAVKIRLFQTVAVANISFSDKGIAKHHEMDDHAA